MAMSPIVAIEEWRAMARKRARKQRSEQEQPVPRDPTPRDRFVTVRARSGFSYHIYAPEVSDRTLCNLTTAEEIDSGIDFEDYESRCKREHFAPKFYCAPCSRAYLTIHGIHEKRWDRWDGFIDGQVPGSTRAKRRSQSR